MTKYKKVPKTLVSFKGSGQEVEIPDLENIDLIPPEKLFKNYKPPKVDLEPPEKLFQKKETKDQSVTEKTQIRKK